MASERQGTRCKYLIDTSALYPILVSGVAFNAEECAVSSITEYEIGNVLWRENQQKKLKDPKRVATIFSEAIRPLRKIEIDLIANVLAVAIERRLTFYDASYTYLTEKKTRRLIVCDFGELGGIITSSDLIRSPPEIPETMKVWFDIDYFMTKQVITADKETLVESVAKIMAAKHIGSVIITEQEEPIGIFTERDLLTKFLAKEKSLIEEVGEACSSPLITAPTRISVHDAAYIMASKHIRRLPITREHKLVGILSAGDLVEAYAANEATFRLHDLYFQPANPVTTYS